MTDENNATVLTDISKKFVFFGPFPPESNI